jgi:chloramphenicol 3-O phosphotransferase
MPAQIIYLNGPSSAGKSTLAKLLQAKLPAPYLHIGIDHLISLMPARCNDWSNGSAAEGFSFQEVKDEQGIVHRELWVGPFGKKIADTYIEVVELLARLGHFVIVDDVAIRPGEVDEWSSVFRGRRVLLVGVTASVEELERRERARGDRPPGSARAQHKKIIYDDRYALVVDTSVQSFEACADAILAKAMAP